MSDLTINAVNSQSAVATQAMDTASKSASKTQLREQVEELVGVTFFGQMLKIARDNPLKGEYGHGGRGEEVFGSQLDMEFARNMGHAVRNDLTEAIYKQLSRGE